VLIPRNVLPRVRARVTGYILDQWNILCIFHMLTYLTARCIAIANPKYCAIFSALLRTCFFYCQNRQQCARCLHIVCLCIERGQVFWQNMIWSGFFYEYFRYSSRAWLRSRQIIASTCIPLPSILFPFAFANSHFSDYARATMVFVDSPFRSYCYSILFFKSER